MLYTQDIAGAFEKTAGADGAPEAAYAAALKGAAGAVERLRALRDDGSLPVLSLPEREDDLSAIDAAAKRIRDHADTLVIVGMGGSSLSGRAFTALTQDNFARVPKGVRVHTVDNIDPATIDRLLTALDFSKTSFLIVSKSGNTAETLANLLILLKAASGHLNPKALAEHFTFITEPGDNPLTRIAAAHNIPVLTHDPKIGGRFAALTCVGLLPAAVAGLDIRKARAGALSVTRNTFSHADGEPAIGAAISRALLDRGKTLSVMMPYCDRLNIFSAWHQQIWAESLGKDGKGMTPLRSLGAVDQHSHLQLYLDGPRDKFLTLLLLAQAGNGPRIPPSEDAELQYLHSHHLGDLMDAEQRGTMESLTRNQVPLRSFTLQELDEEALGALMMHFIIETMIMAQLLGINAFDQPAVEQGKVLAREYLKDKK